MPMFVELREVIAGVRIAQNDARLPQVGVVAIIPVFRHLQVLVVVDSARRPAEHAQWRVARAR
eukprot:11203974-Lingulodinium_polyedra.AAC.1